MHVGCTKKGTSDLAGVADGYGAAGVYLVVADSPFVTVVVDLWAYFWGGVVDGGEDLALRALLRQCGNTVYNRARNTVKASSALVGTKWCRVPEPAACEFCLLVASRGAVYASQTTALNTKETKNRYHANCRCGAEEVFDDDDMPAPTKRLVDVSEWVGTSKDDWRKAKSDPEFVRHIWQTYIRDDPTRQARLGPSRLPAGFEVKYPKPADLPEGSKLPGVTLRDLEIAIVGGTDHRGKPIGGHDYGTGIPGKTEFPPAWNSDDIIHATFLTLENPQWFDIWGQQRVCRREVNGVIMHIAYYPQSDGELKMAHIYPLNGEDVYENPGKNRPGGPVPFDANALIEPPRHHRKLE